MDLPYFSTDRAQAVGQASWQSWNITRTAVRCFKLCWCNFSL